MEARAIKEGVNQWETGRWKSEVESKSMLVWYRERQGIFVEAGYDNSWGSVLLFRVRIYSLSLGWWESFWGGDVRCPMCGPDEETLEHFLEECEVLQGVRVRCGLLEVRDVLSFGGCSWGDVREYCRVAGHTNNID